MDWEEIEKKHKLQWDVYEMLKQDAWNDHLSIVSEMKESFGHKEDQIPESVRQRELLDYNKWTEQWSFNGEKARKLKARQEQEIAQLREEAKRLIKERLRLGKEKRRERDDERER